MDIIIHADGPHHEINVRDNKIIAFDKVSQ